MVKHRAPGEHIVGVDEVAGSNPNEKKNHSRNKSSTLKSVGWFLMGSNVFLFCFGLFLFKFTDVLGVVGGINIIILVFVGILNLFLYFLDYKSTGKYKKAKKTSQVVMTTSFITLVFCFCIQGQTLFFLNCGGFCTYEKISESTDYFQAWQCDKCGYTFKKSTNR